jgi:hypothetical protein
MKSLATHLLLRARPPQASLEKHHLKNAHVLGAAPAPAKAKLGKAKPSKNAGKLGKVGKKEVLGKGKRMLAPRISDVSLAWTLKAKKAKTASSSQVMCLQVGQHTYIYIYLYTKINELQYMKHIKT